MLHAEEEEEEEGTEPRRMTAKVDYGSANTSNTNGQRSECSQSMWHCHNGRRGEKERERREHGNKTRAKRTDREKRE